MVLDNITSPLMQGMTGGLIGLFGSTALPPSLDFSFATLGGSGAFLALDFDQGAYAVPAALGGGSYSTTAYETTTDLSQALTVSGGGAFIGIVDGVPVEYGAGQFVFDTLDGKKVLRGDAGVTRINAGAFKPSLGILAEVSVTDQPAWGVATPGLVTKTNTFGSWRLFSSESLSIGEEVTLAAIYTEPSAGDIILAFQNTADSSENYGVAGTPGSLAATKGGGAVSLPVILEDIADYAGAGIHLAIVKFTAEAASTYRLYIGNTVGGTGHTWIIYAAQATKTDHFPGWVGGDQATSISRPAITYAWTTRVVTAVQSLGTTGDFATAFRFSAAFDYDRQIHLNNFGSSLLANIRSNNSGIIFGSYGSYRTGEAILQGVGSAIMARSDSVGDTRLLHNTTFDSGGNYTPKDLSTIGTTDNFTLASGGGGHNWAGGMSRVVFAEVYPTQTQMEAWRDLP